MGWMLCDRAVAPGRVRDVEDVISFFLGQGFPALYGGAQNYGSDREVVPILR